LKVSVTFAEAWTEFENEKKREENRMQQVEICNKLHEKVNGIFGGKDMGIQAFDFMFELSRNNLTYTDNNSLPPDK
jgi:hypothetical protein